MGNEEDRWRIRELLKSEKEGWKRDRLIALGMGFSPDNSLESIAATIGRSVPTVQRWFRRYRDEGLEAALTRGSSAEEGPQSSPTSSPNACAKGSPRADGTPGCFRSWEGAEVFAAIRSYASTCSKRKESIFYALAEAISGQARLFA